MKKNEEIKRRWEGIYRGAPLEALPWEQHAPSDVLVALVESGVVAKGPALDICCGSGHNAVYLAQQGFICYGIDISPTAIGYARERAAKEGVTCQLSAGNALELPYPDSTFTLVFDRGCFHSMAPADRETYIKGVYRVLQPTGKYLLGCFSSRDHSYGPPYGFSPADIRRYFSKLFKIHSIEEFPYGNSYFLTVLMEKPATG